MHSLSADLPGKLRRISDQLAERLNQGESLDSALATGGTTFPPLYRAIVAAGIKSGKLPSALEQLGATARRLTALSRLTFLAMLYPLMVLLFGYGLFLFFITQIAPIIYHSAPTFTPPPIVRSVAGLGAHVRWWGPIFPILVIVAVVIWWYRSRGAMVLQSGVASRLFGWMSPFRRFLNETRAAGFAEMLALLVEHQVPLEQSRLTHLRPRRRETRRHDSSGARRGGSDSVGRFVRRRQGFSKWRCRNSAAASVADHQCRQTTRFGSDAS